VKILKIILFSSIAGAMYRLGGWIQTKIRDLGVPCCGVAVMLQYPYVWWQHLLFFFLAFAGLTTYFKKKGTDAMWWNWLFVGLAFSFCAIPYAFPNHWLGFGIRTIVCTGLVVGISELSGNVWVEETGRGIILVGSLPLLWI